jgi:hypothetical protein
MIDPKKQYKTRDGCEVRIYALDGDEEMPVHGAVLTKHGWKVNSWARDGRWCPNVTDGVDLIEVKPRIQREVWVNVYRHDDGVEFYEVRSNKEDADGYAGDARIACVKVVIDCEEGEGL